MAMLTRYDPFRNVFRMQGEIARVLDDRLGLRAGESVGWTPACDIFEDGEAVTLRFELAGVAPKDVDIRFESGVITLRGERKMERDEKQENYRRVEMSYGLFTRTFSLPAAVDPERIKAEAKPRPISVKVSSAWGAAARTAAGPRSAIGEPPLRARQRAAHVTRCVI